MKRAKRYNPAPAPDMVEGFLFTLAIGWNSYASRLGQMLDHYGPEAFSEETYAMLRLIAVSLTSHDHLEQLEKHMLEVKGLGSMFPGGVMATPPTQAEHDRIQARVDEVMGGIGQRPKGR